MEDTFTAFADKRIVARGTRGEIARALAARGETSVLIFSDSTGRETDVDLSGGVAGVAERYPERPARGRPKLGVVAREVTLLPRHWDWLATQRGGASAALRRLVEDASRGDDTRMRRDAAYRFCSAIAGDLPGFEEAMRALYAGDERRLATEVSGWPEDIRNHLFALAGMA